MFGANEKVGEKFFREAALKPDVGFERLLVTSIFLTLQGEGPFMGRPAVFIRLAKCNLACSFCDTYFDDGSWMSISELLSTAYNLIRARYDNAGQTQRIGFVITGGEPTLQPLLPELCARLAETGTPFVQIESNGILTRDGLNTARISLVLSPKCIEADTRPANRRALHYLRPNPAMLAQAVCLKFVVTADPDSAYHTIPDWAHEWAHSTGKPIYISPMNVYAREPDTVAAMRAGGQPTLEERSRAEVVSFWTPGLLDNIANKANHEYAAQFALDNGYYLSLQMHLYAGVA